MAAESRVVVGLPVPLLGLFLRPLLRQVAVLQAVGLLDQAFVGQLVDFVGGYYFDRVEVPEVHPNDTLDKSVVFGTMIASNFYEICDHKVVS